MDEGKTSERGRSLAADMFVDEGLDFVTLVTS
jgi:hypothetical protein